MFGIISRNFQLKFKDRAAAGSILAEILRDTLKKENLQQCIVVLGVPRGGVVTADSVARILSTAFGSVQFDVILPRKLTDRDNKEQAIGAIMEDGTTYLDEELVNMLGITSQYLEKEKAQQISDIRRRKMLYSAYRQIGERYLKDKTVILVDDGAATGATLIAAARWLRKKNTPKHFIIAVPVAPKNTVKLLEHESDVVKVVVSPSSIFRSVEQYYQDFEQVLEDKVIEILKNRS